MERLGKEAFYCCVQLEHVELASRLREIEKELFRDCVSLKAIKIHEGVEMLGEAAFYGCDQLEHVELPRTLLRIGEGGI